MRDKPIELLLIRDKEFITLFVDYHTGLRYPHLERVESNPDRCQSWGAWLPNSARCSASIICVGTGLLVYSAFWNCGPFMNNEANGSGREMSRMFCPSCAGVHVGQFCVVVVMKAGEPSGFRISTVTGITGPLITVVPPWSGGLPTMLYSQMLWSMPAVLLVE